MKNFISSFFLAYFVWISSGMGVLFVIVFVMLYLWVIYRMERYVRGDKAEITFCK